MAGQHQNVFAFAQLAEPRPGVWSRLKAAAGRWRVWTRDSFELRMLMAIDDDRLLRDAGINRYDAQWEMRRPFWDCGGGGDLGEGR
jgi:uncharacterized protein YjiS (DUF1127 family)